MTTHERHEVPAQLHGHHLRTYEALFRHPAAHNLEWHDVRSLLATLADVEEGHDGSLQVTRNGRMVILHPSRHKDIASVEVLLTIRRFLEQSSEIALPPP
jgi:hypothetical protein